MKSRNEVAAHAQALIGWPSKGADQDRRIDDVRHVSGVPPIATGSVCRREKRWGHKRCRVFRTMFA